MSKWFGTAFLTLMVFLFFCPQSARAQRQGTISGLVTDKSGAPVPNAQIKLTNEATGLSRNFVSNQSGNYDMPAVVIGKYTIEVSAPGFADYKQTGINVNVDDRLRIDAQLELRSVQETVVVQADTVHIQAEDATVGQVVNSQQVEALSVNGRNFTSLAALVPGASSTQPALKYTRGRHVKYRYFIQRHAPE